jgi:hypothetical protein
MAVRIFLSESRFLGEVLLEMICWNPFLWMLMTMIGADSTISSFSWKMCEKPHSRQYRSLLLSIEAMRIRASSGTASLESGMGVSVVKMHVAVALCIRLQCGGGVTVSTTMFARRLKSSELRFVSLFLHSAIRARLVFSSQGPAEVWVLEVSCSSIAQIPLSCRESVIISMMKV